MAKKQKLDAFEGKAVVGAAIEIPNAAGGLNKALALDPVQFAQGDEFTVALRVRVSKIRHEPSEKGEPEGEQVRVHIAPSMAAAILEGNAVDLAAEQIDATQEKIHAAEEAEALVREEARLAAQEARDLSKAEAQRIADEDAERQQRERDETTKGVQTIEEAAGTEKISNVVDLKSKTARKPRKPRATKRTH